jgi:multidrug efflux pump subunit AcrB
VRLALSGSTVADVHDPYEAQPLRIVLRMPRRSRSAVEDLQSLPVKGETGVVMPIGSIGRWTETTEDKTIYHKNLERIVYVFAEVAGRAPAEAIIDIEADEGEAGGRRLEAVGRNAERGLANNAERAMIDDAQEDPGSVSRGSSPPRTRNPKPETRDPKPETRNLKPETRSSASSSYSLQPTAHSLQPTAHSLSTPRPLAGRTFLRNGGGVSWSAPDGVRVNWAGEGEWKITLDVFRDLGIAFAAACLGIYVLLVYQTGSYFMPLILMISIPLTMIGIMPGFWLLDLIGNRAVGGYPNPTFFTATAMIGMIALSGIAVRNAILLIEFVHEALRRGEPLQASLVNSGAVRFRPIVLTSAAAMLGAWPITLDPIFSGLAWALIFGLFVSTAFTLLIIPVVYDLVYRNKPGHGLRREDSA